MVMVSTIGASPAKAFGWSNIPISYALDILIVAGGGGGGGTSADQVAGGGGAGGGGILDGSLTYVSGATLTLAVGGGGAKGTIGEVGAKGSNSSIIYQSVERTAYGGGAGRDADDSNTGISDGGSAGGASGSAGGAAGTATQNSQGLLAGYGNAGGTKNDSNAGSFAGGGGGGAGGAASGRTRGVGRTSSISGTSTTYAAGGYGQGTSNFINAGVSGSANTGDGGNGATNGPTGASNGAGAGGSGVVIVRYSDTFPAASSTTGSPSVTVSGGYRIYTFTSSGSITF